MSGDEAMIKGLHESLSSLDTENREYEKYKNHLESAISSVLSANERLLKSYNERCGILDKTNKSIKEYDRTIKENQAKLNKLRVKNATLKKFVVDQSPNQTILAMKKLSKKYKEDTEEIEQHVLEMLKNNPNVDEVQQLINNQKGQYKSLRETNNKLRAERELAVNQAIQFDNENGKQLEKLLQILLQKIKENNRLYRELENTELNPTNLQNKKANEDEIIEYFDLIDLLDEDDFEDENLRSLARGESIDSIKFGSHDKIPDSLLQQGSEKKGRFNRHVVKDNGDEYDYVYSENEDGTKGSKKRYKKGDKKMTRHVVKDNGDEYDYEYSENEDGTKGSKKKYKKHGKNFRRHVVKDNGDEFEYEYSEIEDGTKGDKKRYKVGKDKRLSRRVNKENGDEYDYVYSEDEKGDRNDKKRYKKRDKNFTRNVSKENGDEYDYVYSEDEDGEKTNKKKYKKRDKRITRHVIKDNGDEYDYSYSENEDGTKGNKKRHKKYNRHVVKSDGDEYDYVYSENEDGSKGSKKRYKKGDKKFTRRVTKDNGDEYDYIYSENEDGSRGTKTKQKVDKKVKKIHHTNPQTPKKYHHDIEGIELNQEELSKFNSNMEAQMNDTEIMTDYSALQEYRNTENQQKHLNLMLHEKVFNEISALETSIHDIDQSISVNEEIIKQRELELKQKISSLSFQKDVAQFTKEPATASKLTVDIETLAKSEVEIQDLKNQIAENNAKTSETFLQEQQALDLRDSAAKLELELSVIRLANDRKTNELNGLMAKLKNIDAQDFSSKPERLRQIKMNMSDREKIERRKERLEGVDKILKQREIDLVKLERKVVDLQTINESIQREIREKVASPKIDIKAMCDDLKNSRQKMKDAIRINDFLRIECDALKDTMTSLQQKYNEETERVLSEKVEKLEQTVEKQKQRFFSLKGVTNSTITLTCDDELLWLQVRLNEIKEAIDVIKMRAGSTATKIDKQIKQCKDLNIPIPEPPEEYEDVLNARFQKRAETYN